jgi:hypothetical protein
LQEQTIIDLVLTDESDEGRDEKDLHKGTSPSRHEPNETRPGHVSAARSPRGVAGFRVASIDF